MINHILVHKLYDEDYVTHPHQRALPRRRGLRLQGRPVQRLRRGRSTPTTRRPGAISSTADGKPQVAKSLDDPHCIFTRLQDVRLPLHARGGRAASPASRPRRSSRSPSTMAKNRPGTILYALGMTQHTTGVQGIRGFTILQLLLGNIGKPGGGVNALRGEPNVQGACDMGGAQQLPARATSTTRRTPSRRSTAWTKNNGTAPPQVPGQHAQGVLRRRGHARRTTSATPGCRSGARRRTTTSFGIFESALAGEMKMLWMVGQNPAVTSPNLKIVLRRRWASSRCWSCRRSGRPRPRPSGSGPASIPKSIQTEVLLLPAAFFMEKNGIDHATPAAMVQWRHAAVKPPGQAKPDGEIVDYVFRRVRDLVARLERAARTRSSRRPSGRTRAAEDVLREINGRALSRRPGTKLKAGDLAAAGWPTSRRTARPRPARGSTRASSAAGENLSKRRDSRHRPRRTSACIRTSPGPGRTTCASSTTARPAIAHGKPYPGIEAASSGGTRQAKQWTGYDVPDVPVLTDGPGHAERPARVPPERRGRRAALRRGLRRSRPEERRASRATRATSRRTGRCPRCTSRSRARSRTSLHPKVADNPMLKYPRVTAHQPIGTVDDFPYVLMTSTVAEHWCARLDHPQHPVAQRARARAGDRDAGAPRARSSAVKPATG